MWHPHTSDAYKARHEDWRHVQDDLGIQRNIGQLLVFAACSSRAAVVTTMIVSVVVAWVVSRVTAAISVAAAAAIARSVSIVVPMRSVRRRARARASVSIPRVASLMASAVGGSRRRSER